jgi:hypothetical protein
MAATATAGSRRCAPVPPAGLAERRFDEVLGHLGRELSPDRVRERIKDARDPDGILPQHTRVAA